MLLMNVDILSMTVYVIFAGIANIVATTSTDLTMDMSGASAAEGNACKISVRSPCFSNKEPEI